MRVVCPDCGEYMEVEKNWVKVRPKNYYGYFYGDVFRCPLCKKEVILIADEEIVSDEEVDYDFNDHIIVAS